MKLEDLIFQICRGGGEADCDNLKICTRKDGSKFYWCTEYNRPITKKILEECWNFIKDDLVCCSDCGIFFINGNGKCPECGSTNLRKARSFEEEWEE